MAQFKVPQKIDLEDKIIGPLTMAQFLYLMVGGMVDYVLLQTIGVQYTGPFLIVGIPIALFSLAMAFLKINDIPFPRFVQAAILYLISPKQWVWHKALDMSSPVKIEAVAKKVEPRILKKRIEKSEIEKMASVLDTSGWAAVRDAHLKDFVTEFDKTHHYLEGNDPQQENPKSEAPIPKQEMVAHV